MRVGLLQVFNENNWVGYAIDQAMKLCDKLIIIEGSQFKKFKEISVRSTDGTLDILYDKLEKYSDRIELYNTTRRYQNYRKNQAANFNFALSKLNIGDYLIRLDADEFFFEEYINKIKKLSDEGEVDYLLTKGIVLAFSFNWQLIINNQRYPLFQILYKKNKKLKFIPTHKPINHGSVKISDEESLGLIHYMWVKPKDRIFLRLKTARATDKLTNWFQNNWDDIELIENKEVKFFDGTFHLKRYNGPHPKILDNHSWRNVADIRKI
jgi:hypothetical protein